MTNTNRSTTAWRTHSIIPGRRVWSELLSLSFSLFAASTRMCTAGGDTLPQGVDSPSRRQAMLPCACAAYSLMHCDHHEMSHVVLLHESRTHPHRDTHALSLYLCIYLCALPSPLSTVTGGTPHLTASLIFHCHHILSPPLCHSNVVCAHHHLLT